MTFFFILRSNTEFQENKQHKKHEKYREQFKENFEISLPIADFKENITRIPAASVLIAGIILSNYIII